MNKAIVMSLLEDRPVAYHPDIARIVGGVKAAVFLCQLLYWTGKGKRPDGFIWKTQAEMEKETGLSRYEQEGARKKLGALEVLEEKRMGIPAKLHYRVNTSRLLALMETFYKQDCGKPTNKIAENPQTIPEITPEITTEHGEDAAGEFDSIMGPRQHPIPQGQPVQSNGDWRERLQGNPHLAWGGESQEMQRQVERYGSKADPILRLGYELDRALGLRPAWSNRQEVKTWTSGLVECLENAEHDWQLVITTARQMRGEGLSIKSPHSIKGMVTDAAAKKRSKAIEHQRAQQCMAEDPQAAVFRQLREAKECEQRSQST